MSAPLNTTPLLWVDLETTGLDEALCRPLEIAFKITDPEFNVLHEYSWVIHQTIVLNDLSEWVRDTHTSNGLLAEVVKSTHSVNEIDRSLRTRMSNYFYISDDKPPLCGSTITFERRWLSLHFPEFYEQISYRSVDVSSLKELMQRWKPDEAISRTDTSKHRAADDINDSIDELRHYRSVLNWGL